MIMNATEEYLDEGQREQAITLLAQEYTFVYNRNQPLIDQLELVISALQEPMDNIKVQLRDLLEPGETVDTPLAKVQMRKGYERKSWETKSLEGYAVDHPEVLQWRKVTEVKPSLIVKVK